MSVSVVERDDVAYVGKLNSSTEFILACQSYISDDVYQPQYRIPVMTYDAYTQSNLLVFGGSYLTNLLTGNSDGFTPLKVKAIPTDDGYNFQAYDFNNNSVGFLYVNDRTFISVSPDYKSTFNVIPHNPSGYGNGSLLAGVRYEIAYTGGYSGILTIPGETVATNDVNNDLGGLFNYPNGYIPDSFVSVPWYYFTFALIPIEMSSYKTTEPEAIGLAPPTMRVAQCVSLPGTGYSNGSYCTDFDDNRGFVQPDDVQDIIYFYSQDGSCGQSYTFNNWLSEDVNVSSSIGDGCTDTSCNYIDGEFKCQDLDIEPDSENDDSGDDGDDGDDDSLLSTRSLIMIAIIAVILIILVLVIVFGVIYATRGNSSEDDKTIAVNV